MDCKNCYKQIPSNSDYCMFCGTPQKDDLERNNNISKTDVDVAMEKKDFKFIWDAILNQNNSYAEYKYESFFLDIMRKVRDMDEFEGCTRKIKALAEKGYKYPLYLYGMALIEAHKEHGIFSGRYLMGNSKKEEEGIEIVITMAKAGQTSAEKMYGIWCKHGINGQTKNDIKAYKMLRKAADKLHPAALYQLAISYAKGELGLEEDYDKFFEYIEKAAFFGVRGKEVDLYTNEINVNFDEGDRNMKLTPKILDKYPYLTKLKDNFA